MIRHMLQKKQILLLSRIILGGLFIYASVDKIINPLAFAQIIHHYRLTPPELINFIAIVIPSIEFVAGLILIVGFRTRAASLVINLLLLFFIVILTITAARGINVACGCFTTSSAVKSNLIIRIIEDFAMLIPGLHILLFYRSRCGPEKPARQT